MKCIGRVFWRLMNKIMITDLGLCDSFDEEDIEELQAELQEMAGPQLRHFQVLEEEQPILSFSCIDIIRGLLDSEGKDVRLVGRDGEAGLRAFLYVLLLLGAEQRRNYPHLNTLIKQQFYKPNIFRHQQSSSANDESRAMLDKCLQYFQEVGEGLHIEEYLLREPLFEQACLIMLRNSLEDEGKEFQQLARKFNIDLRVASPQPSGQCYHMGVGSHYQVVRERDYFFLALTEGRDDLNQSKLELESIRSGESGLHLIVAPQASDQSTPKFKNSEVKFRKKSHKNSFGGDLQIVQYRDLLHLQTQKLAGNNANKVLSEYFDVNEVESCAQHMDLGKKHSFQDIIDSQKMEMKGSTTLSPSAQHLERRNRKISSSQIIQYRDFGQKKEEHKVNEPLEEEEEEDHHKPHSYNSLVMVKDQQQGPLAARMRTSLIQQKELERIQQRQSSQRQSTHPDQQSQHSEQRQAVQSESHLKLKDRKYSYFTQQMASTKHKQAKQAIESSNYVFRIPKNQHKNSEVILPSSNDHQAIRKRFQENPLRFSQLGGAPSQSSAQESFLQQPRKPPQCSLRLASSLYSYQINFQPINWYKKEVIYHLDNGRKDVQVTHRNFARPLQTHKQERSLIRESVDSSHSLSQLRIMKDSNNFTAYHPSQTAHSINPYQLNETSFLKNRIQSMANLDPFEPDKEDTKSAVFTTCRSLKNISSPTKINFKYLASPKNTINNPPRPISIIPTSSLPQPQPTLQFSKSKQFQLTPPSPRPQTYNGFLNGPGPALDSRFTRR